MFLLLHPSLIHITCIILPSSPCMHAFHHSKCENLAPSVFLAPLGLVVLCDVLGNKPSCACAGPSVLRPLISSLVHFLPHFQFLPFVFFSSLRGTVVLSREQKEKIHMHHNFCTKVIH